MSLDNSTHTLWVERYRPTTLETYIGNDHVKSIFANHIDTNDVPHLLLHGSPGTGKTTIAKLLLKNIDCDYIVINASDENNVETVRTKIKGFASSAGFKSLKVVLLDEADYLSISSQAILRNLMEEFSAHCRFILTCNYVERIIDAVKSRCQVLQILPPDRKQIAIHVGGILKKEGVQFDPKVLVTVVNSGYPDIRKIINVLQTNSFTGTLTLDEATGVINDYTVKIIDILKSKADKKAKYTDIRQALANSKVKDFTDLYSALYNHVDDYASGNTAGAILAIAAGQINHVQSTDKEIPTAATLIEILNII